MTTAEAPDLALGMVKLTRKLWPVEVNKYPTRLAQVMASLDAVQGARDARDESLLERLAVKLKLGTPTPSLDQQVKLLQEKADVFKAQVIKADLVPLTESEVYLVRAQYTSLMLFLKKKMLTPALSEDAAAAVNQAIDVQCNMAWQHKWVGLALRVTGTDKAYYPEGLPDDIEPNAVGELYVAYHGAFTLTEEELKKSFALTTPKRN